MSLINRMVIGEDDNFDLYGCIRIYGYNNGLQKLFEREGVLIREIIEKYAIQSKKDKNDSKVVHFIWAGRTDASFGGWYQQALFEFFKAELCRNGIQKVRQKFLRLSRLV